MRCKHDNADHLKSGEWFTMRTEHGDQPMHVVDCEQLRCLDCGAWLSLGPANDDDERVAVEIRAALLAIDVGAEETFWTSEEIGGGFVAAAREPGGTRSEGAKQVSWLNYLQSVSVALPCRARLGAEDRNGLPYVFVELIVRCHETGETITVKTGRCVQPLGMLTDREAAEVIRDLCRIAMCHEIDEAITIDGERPFNPHRAAPSAKAER